jgi:hypothetical protein
MIQRGGSDVFFTAAWRSSTDLPDQDHARNHLAQWCGRGDAAQAGVVRPDLFQAEAASIRDQEA